MENVTISPFLIGIYAVSIAKGRVLTPTRWAKKRDARVCVSLNSRVR